MRFTRTRTALGLTVVASLFAGAQVAEAAEGEYWARVGSAAFTDDGLQEINGIAATPAGVLIAVGSDATGGGGDTDAAVWRSTDSGTSWERRSDTDFDIPGIQRLNAVTATLSAIVAVGYDASGTGGGGDAAIWRSVDGGLTWTRQDQGGAGLARAMYQEALGVTMDTDGTVIAVGHDASTGSGDAIAWRSTNDGGTWVLPGSSNLGAAELQRLNAVTATPSGDLVAVGFDAAGVGTEGDGAVWTSGDGQSWAREANVAVPGFGAAGMQELHAVTATPGGVLVAVGSDASGVGGGGDAAVWTSADSGNSWTRRQNVGSAPFGVDGDQYLRGVAASATGIVIAVGHDSLGAGGGGDSAVWRSDNNGTTWSRRQDALGGPFGVQQQQQLNAVTAAGNAVFVAGGFDANGTNAGQDAAVWRSADVPGPPTNVTATPLNAAATVAWQAPASPGGSPITGYRITSYIDGVPQSSQEVGNVLTGVFTGLTNDVTYRFSVAARNSAGYGPESELSNAVTPSASLGGGSIVDPNYNFTCSNNIPTSPFTDIANSFAIEEINCLWSYGLVAGTTSTTYSPSAFVQRDQMAVFLMRAYETATAHAYNGPLDTHFTDIAGNFAELRIQQLGAVGVTAGTSATTYSPSNFVTREEMAVFIVRVFEKLTDTIPPTVSTLFQDTAGSYAAVEISQLFGLKITAGTSATSYGTHDLVSREQMAVFIVRLLEELVPEANQN